MPNDGVYYFTVSDCSAAFSACSPADELTTFDYELKVRSTSNLPFPETTATSANDGTANAATIVYGTKDDANVYQPALISGVFDSPNQTHVFAFTPPDDAAVLGGHR